MPPERQKDGTAAAQIQAFEDTREWSSESQRAYEKLFLRSDKLSSVMRAFMEFLGPNDMMANWLPRLRKKAGITTSTRDASEPKFQTVPAGSIRRH